MKIIIGVTREPEKIRKYLSQYHGVKETLTEVGPFLTSVDALNWLVYLKSRIGDFEEIMPQTRSGKDDVWYGFTFEKSSNN